MVEIIYNIVVVAIAKDVKSTNYISISCDGVTNVDNQSWLSLHTYVI